MRDRPQALRLSEFVVSRTSLPGNLSDAVEARLVEIVSAAGNGDGLGSESNFSSASSAFRFQSDGPPSRLGLEGLLTHSIC